MTHPVVEERRRRRAELLDVVQRWAVELQGRLPELAAVVVVGSVARGDWNKWSDIDVLVVVGSLPDRWPERAELLSPVPPWVAPIAWTVGELAEARRRRNPIAVEADTVGVVVEGALPPP